MVGDQTLNERGGREVASQPTLNQGEGVALGFVRWEPDLQLSYPFGQDIGTTFALNI